MLETFVSTFEAVAILLGMGIVGYVLISRKVMPAQNLKFLEPLSIEIALPCLIFSSIITGFDPSSFKGWWMLPLWLMLFQVIALAFVLLMQFVSKRESRKEFRMMLFYQNAVFFPLVIIAELFGAHSDLVVKVFLLTILFPPIFFNTYRYMLGIKGHMDWKKVFNPILLSTIFAITIKLMGVDAFIPSFVVSTADMIGAMSLPLLMLILGGNVFVDNQGKGDLQVVEVLKFVFLKNILFPALFLGLVYMVRPPQVIALLLLIQAAVPPYTTNAIIIGREGGNRQIANQFLIGSFVLSLATLPVMLTALSFIYPG